MSIRHRVHFDFPNFRFEAEGAYFGATMLCFFAVAVALVRGVIALF
jgi:hypothetical protein